MPVDITMCEGGACPLRDRCYRYRSVPVGRQDWLGSPPYSVDTGACPLFWDIAELAPTPEQVRQRAYWIWQRSGQPEGQAEAHWAEAEAELWAAYSVQLRG